MITTTGKIKKFRFVSFSSVNSNLNILKFPSFDGIRENEKSSVVPTRIHQNSLSLSNSQINY